MKSSEENAMSGGELGHRFAERGQAIRHRGIGSVYEHVLEDDRTRVANRETCPPRRPNDAADFLERGGAHFAALGVRLSASC